MVYLKDIAERVGVSVSLVSKVLNNQLGTTMARAELVKAIRTTARDMGYRKNYSAAGLRHGRHNAFGVFIHRQGVAGSGLVENLLLGISDASNERRQKQVLNFFDTAEEFRDYSQATHRGLVDGLIIGGIAHPDLTEDFNALAQSGMPVVTIFDHKPEGLPFANIGLDQPKIGALATKHLIDQGCKRILHIKVHDYRFNGYKAALAEAGIEFEPLLVYPCDPDDFSYAAARKAIRRKMSEGVEFDGVVAQCDEQAVAAMNALLEMGRKIPDEIKIIGCDDAPYCKFSLVPISSVSQNYRARGELAVRMLMDVIDGKEVTSITVEPELQLRASSLRN